MRRIYDSVLVSIIGSSVRAFLSSRFLIRIGASHHSQHKQLTIRLFKQNKKLDDKQNVMRLSKKEKAESNLNENSVELRRLP